jgi:hypothetical protein
MQAIRIRMLTIQLSVCQKYKNGGGGGGGKPQTHIQFQDSRFIFLKKIYFF